MARWIPADLVQNAAEYVGRVANLLSFRGVSTTWHAAVSDAVGFLNERCWTQLRNNSPLWLVYLDRTAVVARCAVLCLGCRLETVEWKKLGSSQSNVQEAGICGLELIPQLEKLNLELCKQTTDVSVLRNCRALKKLDLSFTSVTNAGIAGLELIPTLEELKLTDCKQMSVVSFLRNCRVLKKLDLSFTDVTEAGIRGLELIPQLEDLNLEFCKRTTDVSFLRSCRALKKLDLSFTSVKKQASAVWSSFHIGGTQTYGLQAADRRECPA
jgi:Leucine-rich repeat (LRR) protein